MDSLSTLVQKLDDVLNVRALDADPGMSLYVPMVYDPLGFDWRSAFEPDFTTRFNGLLLRGAEHVNTVFCSVFPTPEVLAAFLAASVEGDLLFLHHPIDMECGDPRGKWGRGFLPIAPETIHALQAKRLSVYAVHAPMDTSRSIGTTTAIAAALDLKWESDFYPYGSGFAGVIGTIPPTNTDKLIAKLQTLFDIPYVDFEGAAVNNLRKVAIVPGGGDKVEAFRHAEEHGVQAYITGEIHHHIDNDRGRQRYAEAQAYAQTTRMSLIGVSHAASEFLVMKTQMTAWFEQHCSVKATTIPYQHWWR